MKKWQIRCAGLFCAVLMGYGSVLPPMACGEIERISIQEMHNEYERISREKQDNLFWGQGLRAIYPKTWQAARKDNGVLFSSAKGKESIEVELLPQAFLPETFQSVCTAYARKAGGKKITMTDTEFLFTTAGGIVHHLRPFGSKLVMLTFGGGRAQSDTNYSPEFNTLLHSIAPQDYDLEATDLTVQCKDNVIKVKKLTYTYPTIEITDNKAVAKKLSHTFAVKAAWDKKRYLQETGKNNILTEENKYTPTFHNNKYLCFLQSGYNFFSKSAHPISWKIGITFDLTTGEKKSWKELVRPEDTASFTVEAITAKLLATAKEQDIPLYREFSRLPQLPKNYYLDKNGIIHFIFGQYEVAPYSSGIIDINMEKMVKD